MRGTITVQGQKIDLSGANSTKYNFSREWYEAEFDWSDRKEVIEWCTQQFGPQPQQPDAWTRWYSRLASLVFFRDEQDYMLFLLRWL